MTTTTNYEDLEWIDGRWHCDGRPIHAGDVMELLGTDNRFSTVRIESELSGRRLLAYFSCGGAKLVHPVETDDRLRWPRPKTEGPRP